MGASAKESGGEGGASWLLPSQAESEATRQAVTQGPSCGSHRVEAEELDILPPSRRWWGAGRPCWHAGQASSCTGGHKKEGPSGGGCFPHGRSCPAQMDGRTHRGSSAALLKPSGPGRGWEGSPPPGMGSGGGGPCPALSSPSREEQGG